MLESLEQKVRNQDTTVWQNKTGGEISISLSESRTSGAAPNLSNSTCCQKMLWCPSPICFNPKSPKVPKVYSSLSWPSWRSTGRLPQILGTPRMHSCWLPAWLRMPAGRHPGHGTAGPLPVAGSSWAHKCNRNLRPKRRWGLRIAKVHTSLESWWDLDGFWICWIQAGFECVEMPRELWGSSQKSQSPC